MAGRLFQLSAERIDGAALRARLEHRAAGGCVTFEGWVRDHHDGRAVTALEYEAYEALALSEGEKIIAETRARFEIIEALCVHRVGRLAIGDMAVWVGVSAAHRGAAFEACRTIIDEVKARVPIWKKEAYAEGGAGWISNLEAIEDSSG